MPVPRCVHRWSCSVARLSGAPLTGHMAVINLPADPEQMLFVRCVTSGALQLADLILLWYVT
jgi:hypothetical protein